MEAASRQTEKLDSKSAAEYVLKLSAHANFRSLQTEQLPNVQQQGTCCTTQQKQVQSYRGRHSACHSTSDIGPDVHRQEAH